jgi:hypothetical protein
MHRCYKPIFTNLLRHEASQAKWDELSVWVQHVPHAIQGGRYKKKNAAML